jgi:hypothetical protein
MQASFDLDVVAGRQQRPKPPWGASSRASIKSLARSNLYMSISICSSKIELFNARMAIQIGWKLGEIEGRVEPVFCRAFAEKQEV